MVVVVPRCVDLHAGAHSSVSQGMTSRMTGSSACLDPRQREARPVRVIMAVACCLPAHSSGAV